ncbi:2826_t:CDS:2 [Rhizophagus irregularis]|nr:2826_t:CDS:2 [Rhizophagus irregularis]
MTIRAFIRECEAKIERKDRIVWTVEDGVAYEESSGSLEPRRNTSAVKGKKQSLKEKITESKI